MTAVDPSLYIPKSKAGFVHWGNSALIRKIVSSNQFVPVWIFGEAGSGKTETVMQIHAELNKPILRVNITSKTDESDLFGGISLTVDPVSGQTVSSWQDGPIIVAMQHGWSVLLDEIDAGSAANLQCLFPVFEGNPAYIKRINRRVDPAPGFNIYSTANTNGLGDESGRYNTAMVQSAALLDRQAIMIRQVYPPIDIEKKILVEVADSIEKFSVTTINPQYLARTINLLLKWSEEIRKAHAVTGDGTLSTRKLIAIVKGIGIFGNLSDSVAVALNSYPADVANGFQSMLDKISSIQIKELDKLLFSDTVEQVKPVAEQQAEIEKKLARHLGSELETVETALGGFSKQLAASKESQKKSENILDHTGATYIIDDPEETMGQHYSSSDNPFQRVSKTSRFSKVK